MAKVKRVTLPLPLKGVVARTSHAAAPVDSASSALNVIPQDADGRVRIASRPGLGKTFAQEVGSGNPIRMLDEVARNWNYAIENKLKVWEDDFEGPEPNSYPLLNGKEGELARWVADPSGTIEYYAHTALKPAYMIPWNPTSIARSVEFPDDVDWSDYVAIDIRIPPVPVGYPGNKIWRTVGSWGIEFHDGDSGWKLKAYLNVEHEDVNTVINEDTEFIEYTVLGFDPPGNDPYELSATMVTNWDTTTGGVMRFEIDGTVATIYINGTAIATRTFTSPPNTPKAYLSIWSSWAVKPDSVLLYDTPAAIEWVRVLYSVEQGDYYGSELVTSANGELWREREAGTLSKLTTSLSLADDHYVCSAAMRQKLYIADWSESKIAGTGGVFNDVSNALTDAAVSDWTQYGISTDDDLCYLYSSTTGVGVGVYKISAVSTSSITLVDGPASGNYAYMIQRGAKVYDPAEDTLSLLWADEGTVPFGCKCIAVYRDRLVLAGPNYAPYMWYMSRMSDPLDWDYGADAEDLTRAVAGQVSATLDAPTPQAAITALIPIADDVLIIASETMLWAMRGDPVYGGQLDILSREAGVLMPTAWCAGPDGDAYFIGRDGLYHLSLRANDVVANLSAGRVPRALAGIDTKQFEVHMAYDRERRGVWICVTSINGSAGGENWFYDLATESLWPQSFPDDQRPTAMFTRVGGSATQQATLFGGSDGYIRDPRGNYDKDDGTKISSFVACGPYLFADPDERARVVGLDCSLDESSGAVTASIYRAESVESLYSGTTSAAYSASLSGDKRHTMRPGVAGEGVMVKLNATQKWVLDSMAARIAYAGRRREP